MSEELRALKRSFDSYFNEECTAGLNFVKVTLEDPLETGDIHHLSEISNHHSVDIGVKASNEGLSVIATLK